MDVGEPNYPHLSAGSTDTVEIRGGAVKREELPRHPRRHGCRLLREGGNHSVWGEPDERPADVDPTAPRGERLHGAWDLPAVGCPEP
jgi:hypothetical protein